MALGLRPLSSAPLSSLLSTSPGAYTLTGGVGAFTLTGISNSLLYGRTIVPATGSFTLSGIDNNLLKGFVVSCGTGSFVLTGQDATLTFSGLNHYTLTGGTGSFTLTGINNNLLKGYVISNDVGSFTLTGQTTNLLKGYVLSNDAGSFALSGIDNAFFRTYVLTADTGAYTLTGQSNTLTYSGAPAVSYAEDYGVSVFGVGFGQGVSHIYFATPPTATEYIGVSGDNPGEVSHRNVYSTVDTDILLYATFAEGTSKDYSSYNNSYSYSGTTPGFSGEEVNFSGAGISLITWNISSPLLYGDPYTLEGFVTWTSTSNHVQPHFLGIYRYDDQNYNHEYHFYANAGKVAFNCPVFGAPDAGPSASGIGTSKVHWAMVRPSGTSPQVISCYINGVRLFTFTETTVPNATTGKVLMGRDTDPISSVVSQSMIKLTRREVYTGASFTPPTDT